ncbi:WD repeat protein [Niveomyces insectorum RCEF 264]|uniref:Serine-threonine kinase receptor-associated protein n=1 Tax=Niveomyces insectorum RCEF 264 TaxID=1081102 RepID=A0A167UTS2_9HYPO|nr:WD repeat protein [Niveomyces insectorum RCEF 264]
MSNNASESRQYVPLTCHGHSRPVPHINFSSLTKDDNYYLISACKDGNPMLRDGKTGDWIGTFIGHKGAVWQAKLSHDASTAATGSADFTAKIWDTHTGEVLYTLQHNHIVRAIAYPPRNADMVATGGFEKKLRIFDLADVKPQPGSPSNAPVETITVEAASAFEIGAGVHKDTIKFIVWTSNPTTLVTASGSTLRWFDIPSLSCVQEEVLDGEIKSCEVVALAPGYSDAKDIGGGKPVLAVAAGKTVCFWDGDQFDNQIKLVRLSHGVASVGLDLKGRKFAVGEEPGTWVRVYSWDDGSEIDVLKGHHGPVWSIAFSPDGKLYATGSEDGTIKMWKNCEGFYGLWKGNAVAGPDRLAE